MKQRKGEPAAKRRWIAKRSSSLQLNLKLPSSETKSYRTTSTNGPIYLHFDCFENPLKNRGVATFIAEMCVEGPDNSVSAAELLEVSRKFTGNSGRHGSDAIDESFAFRSMNA